MNLRTPRRRISPGTKRRYRAIRNFLRRAIGSASQQNIKINSGIAVNVSSLKHKIFGLNRKLSEASKDCHCQHNGLEDSSRKESASTLRTEIDKDLEEYREQQDKQQDFEYLSDSCSALTDNANNYQRIEYEKKPEPFNMVIPDRVPVSLFDGNDIGFKRTKSKRKLNVGASRAVLRTPSITTYENRVNAYSTTSVEIAGPSNDRHRRARRINQRSSRRNCTIDEPILENQTKYTDNTKQRMSPTKHHNQDRQITKRSESPTKYSNQDQPKQRKESPTKYRSQERPKQRTESPTKHRNQDRQKQKSNSRIPEGTLDRDFIADLIERQYSPIRLFGRQSSEISQFTQPVCRDHVPSEPKNTYLQDDPDISSYYQKNLGKAKFYQNSDLDNKRSVCDAKLYGNKRRCRSRHHRNIDAYDSKYYDIIPVKEKASPKSRRKFAEDNLFVNGRSPYYMEVPPSPRSNRPRLNLRAQYFDQYDDYSLHVPTVSNAHSPTKFRKLYVPVETDITTDSQEQHVMDQMRTRSMSSKHCVQEQLEQPTNEMYQTYSNAQEKFTIDDTLITKSQEAIAKTDKALSEIKDLLQTFLTEVKNTSMSKSDHSDSKNEYIQACEPMLPPTTTDRVSSLPSSPNRFQNFNPIHNAMPGSMPSPMPGPYIPPTPNPCYPLLPMYPMNMQHHVSCVMPTPSFTCTACMNNCARCSIHKTADDVPPKEHSEIDNLIKEIHKLVANKEPKGSEFRSNVEDLSARTNVLNRSGGGCSQVRRRDAQVGTTKTRSYSRSCEAIGSTSAAEDSPNVSYSDTVLERMSLNRSIDTTSEESKANEMKVKQRFNVLLKTLGLLKKKKKKPKYALEIISEADNRAFTEPYRPSPFRTDVTNYMYGQEFTAQPRSSPRHYCPYGDHEHSMHKHHYDHYAMHEPKTEGFPRRPPPMRYERGRGHSPSAPPYSSSYVNSPYKAHAALRPLCLKEVEVKSAATQSEVRKPSFFGKFASGVNRTYHLWSTRRR